MSLELLGHVELPRNLKPGGFDHAAVHCASGRLYVAHTANDASRSSKLRYHKIVPDEQRTQTLAWYNLAGSFATAAGALTGGILTQLLQQVGVIPLNSYRTVVVVYGVIGALLALLFTRLSPSVEAARSDSPQTRSRFGLHRSRGVVLKLSTLFGMDALAGGFIVQSIVAYWFHVRFGVEPAALGGISLERTSWLEFPP